MNLYCPTCNGRTDGCYEVGGKLCICGARGVLTHCSWCGKRNDGRGEEDEQPCRCAETAAMLGVTPLPVPVKWDLTDTDKDFLRTNRIDPS